MEQHKKTEQRYVYIDLLRICLMLIAGFISFGVPGYFGSYARVMFGFASIAFFIISGFLTLRHDSGLEQRLVRAIKRTAVLFLVIFLFDLAANMVYYRVFNVPFLSGLASKRLWFEFIVFNQWPFLMGENIWFIQCLLYGYIALYLMVKLKLMRFETPIMLLCFAATLLTGEFAGLIGFNVLGYDHITATVITRSLPYLLLGRFLYRRCNLLLGIMRGMAEKRDLWFWMLVSAVVTAGMTLAELNLLQQKNRLVYTGHMIGNGVFAFLLVAAAVVLSEAVRDKHRKIAKMHFSQRGVKLFYATHQTVAFILFYVIMFMPFKVYFSYSLIGYALMIIYSIAYFTYCRYLMVRKPKKTAANAVAAPVEAAAETSAVVAAAAPEGEPTKSDGEGQ